MRELFLDVIEINIAVSIVFLIVFILKGKLRKRYGAGWLKMVWILLAVRLLIPYNFSLPEDSDEAVAEAMNQDESNYVQVESEAEQLEGQYKLAENEGTVGMPDGDSENPYIATVPVGKGEPLLDKLIPENEQRRILFLRINETLALFWRAGGRIWKGGMLLFFLYYMVSYGYFLAKLRRSLHPIADRNIKRQIDRQQKRLMGRSQISSWQSALAGSPMIVGILAPKLIFPEGKEIWSEEELEFVIAHELCHYQNRDLWLKLLMTAACCINWFNPLVFLLRKQFYYDLELACDGNVLSERGTRERESYARIMLSFAGQTGRETLFSSGFSGSKKQMKRRIDYMLDDARRRKGMVSIAITGLVILTMGLLISCGYQQDDSAQDDGEEGELQLVPYDANNEYNEMIRCYGDTIYIAREDGIYRLSEDGEREELLYANNYRMRRGMEIYQDSLYFCGYGKSQEVANIYRMDLNTYEVEALATFSQIFGEDDGIYNISIYDGKLYVAQGYARRIGFELDESGAIIKPLDTEAEDFLFKADNDYWSLQLKISNNEVEFGSEEYWNTVNQMRGMYRNIIDTASCAKMLNGDQVVIKYKDGLLSSIYLKKENGDYEFLCDTFSYPSLVTETGVYYFPDEGFEIWYVDYETKTQQMIWKKEDRKYREIQLVNYDQEYVYFSVSNQIGQMEKSDNVFDVLRETYLMRVPRWRDGKAEKIYQFGMDQYVGSLQLNCAVADGKMFFNDYETISLDPAQNGMDNSGKPSEEALSYLSAEMVKTAEGWKIGFYGLEG